MAQQIGQPLAVLGVGLATRYRLDVPGIDQEEFKLILE